MTTSPDTIERIVAELRARNSQLISALEHAIRASHHCSTCDAILAAAKSTQAQELD